MKKIILIASLLLVVSGCAFLKGQKANWEACKADPVCFDTAKNWQDKTELSSTIIASAVPFPGAAAIPKILGYISFGAAMLLGGRTLRKKNLRSVIN